MVGKLQAGRYGLNLAVVDRWPLFGGGRYDRFDCMYKLCHVYKRLLKEIYLNDSIIKIEHSTKRALTHFIQTKNCLFLLKNTYK